MKKTITLMIRNIPASTHRALKIKAAQEGRSMQDVLFNLIIEYIEKKEE